MERPVVIGLFWAILSSNWQEPILIAVFFELFWLDTFPAGTYCPPQQTFAVCFTLLVVHTLGLNHVGSIMPVLVAALPLSWLMTQLEIWLRHLEGTHYQLIFSQLEEPVECFQPGRLVWRSLLRSALLNMTAFALVVGCAIFGLKLLFRVWPASIPDLTWGYVLIGGLAAGLLSLRSRRIYQVLIGATLCVLVIFIALR